MTKTELRQFTSWLGKRSYKARVERLGLERIQEIARENGKRGGRPKGAGKDQGEEVMAFFKRGKIWWYKFVWNGELIREK